MLGPSCSKALPVWKRLVMEKFRLMDIVVDVDDLIYDEADGFYGRMCQTCTSALERLGKLESSTSRNVDDAIDEIMNGDRWSKRRITQKRARVSDSPQASVQSHTPMPRPTLPHKSNEEDVAVS